MGHNTCKSMGRVLCVVRRSGIFVFLGGLPRDRPIFLRKKNQLGARPFPTQSSKVAVYSPLLGHHEIDRTFL